MSAPVATLIGDVVASRTSADRRGLHAALVGVLDEVNRATSPVHPLRVTVGDEFQGAWARRGEAVHAALRIRLLLLPDVETRYGLAHGEVAALSEDGTVQDGPGWWLAREAITAAKGGEGPASPEPVVRTRWREDAADAAALDAALRHRDLVLGGLDDRSLRILAGLLEGRTQRAVAEDEGITPTAVSRRVRRHGLDQLVVIDEDLRRLP